MPASSTFLFSAFLVIFFIRWVIENQLLLCLLDYLTGMVKVGDPVIWFRGFHISYHLNFWKKKTIL